MAEELSPKEIVLRLNTNSEQLGEAIDKVDSLAARMERIYMPRETLDLRLHAIEDRLTGQEGMFRREIEVLNDRLVVMQNWQTWAVRLIVGTLITVLISTVVGALFRAEIFG